jgi:SAM-dependent methyltransferase
MPDDATDWFDRLYREAAGDPARVPWAAQAVCPIVADYLSDHPGPGRAVVVGCGIGDDAEAVAAAGYDTLGFDVSPEAIAWCERRYPDSAVIYRVADLFSLPDEWAGRFDLVVEVRTVQSLPPGRQGQVMDAVAGLVAPGGRLLLVALARAEGVVPHGPPWAITRRELERMGSTGLEEVSMELRSGGLWSDFVAVYRRRATNG